MDFQKIINEFDINEQRILEKSKTFNIISGIYFLIYRNKIIYVGYSENVMYRIALYSIDKNLDSYYILKCPKKYHNNLAAHFIVKLNPILNKQLPPNDLYKSIYQLKNILNVDSSIIKKWIRTNRIKDYNGYYKKLDF